MDETIAVSAGWLGMEHRHPTDRTDHLRTLSVLHAAIPSKQDILTGLDRYTADGAAWEFGGHQSFRVVDCQKPAQAPWKRRIRPPPRSRSYSNSVVATGSSHASHGRPLPSPAHRVGDLSDGRMPRATLSAMSWGSDGDDRGKAFPSLIAAPVPTLRRGRSGEGWAHSSGIPVARTCTP